MRLSDVEVVLCRPAEAGNVGAVCRAMKNMGLGRLSLVASAELDVGKLLARAVHAGDVWEKARTFDGLAPAVRDCSLVIGTTCRRGAKRKTSMKPADLADFLARREETGNVALVFGNERTGLEEAELDLCNLASHIPVSADFPSLNLSHAVQVYAYELFLAAGGAENASVKGEWVPLDRNAAGLLAGEICDILTFPGFSGRQGREGRERFLCDLVCRAGLTEREGRYLAELFGKAVQTVEGRLDH